MTGAAEMRRVMDHAGLSLGEAIGSTPSSAPHLPALIAMAYAKGVLDMLGTYLIDTPEEEAPTVPGAGLSLCLLDDDGDLWHPGDDGDSWSCIAVHTGAEHEQPNREALQADQDRPLREVYVR